MKRQKVESACPQCGTVAVRETYDIGDGPELSCANCEWCWGAEGQPLQPITYERMVEKFGYDPIEASRAPKHDTTAHVKAGGFGINAEGCPACESFVPAEPGD